MEPLPYLLLADSLKKSLPDLWIQSGLYDLRYSDENDNPTRPYPESMVHDLSKDDLPAIKYRIENMIAAFPSLADRSLEHQPEYQATVLERAYYGAIDPLTRFPEGWENAKSAGI